MKNLREPARVAITVRFKRGGEKRRGGGEVEDAGSWKKTTDNVVSEIL